VAAVEEEEEAEVPPYHCILLLLLPIVLVLDNRPTFDLPPLLHLHNYHNTNIVTSTIDYWKISVNVVVNVDEIVVAVVTMEQIHGQSSSFEQRMKASIG